MLYVSALGGLPSRHDPAEGMDDHTESYPHDRGLFADLHNLARYEDTEPHEECLPDKNNNHPDEVFER